MLIKMMIDLTKAKYTTLETALKYMGQCKHALNFTISLKITNLASSDDGIFISF